MKNLILGYFHTPASSRGEALRLIGRMLDFSKPDMEQLGLEGGRGWLGGLFKKTNPTPPSTPQASPNKVSHQRERGEHMCCCILKMVMYLVDVRCVDASQLA